MVPKFIPSIHYRGITGHILIRLGVFDKRIEQFFYFTFKNKDLDILQIKIDHYGFL
jgi:hypothetical protein